MPSISGRQLVLDAFARKPVPRAPWVPFVGVHGGKMLGLAADEYLRKPDAIVEALVLARKKYQADGLPVVFDLQIEAEILGCHLHWAKDVPPSVISHPLAKGQLADLPAFSVDKGRMPLALEATRKARQALPDTALYGLICGPFTLASHLLGSEIFVQMFDDPERVQAIIDHCAHIACTCAAAYLAAGADVVAVVDPMTSQVSPKHFKTFVSPYENRIFDAIRAQGGRSSLFVCGDATRNLANMLATSCDNVSIDENVSLAKLRELAQAAGKSFGGNLKLTVVLLLGKPEDVKLDVVRCFDEVGDAPGFVLAPGCDLPYHTPEANLETVAPLLDPYQREVARVTAKSTLSVQLPPLPDYKAQRDAVTVDVITLDSAACAPCQYMMNAVHAAVAPFGSKVRVHEHKVKTPEGIGMMCALKVSNIPTICIDGEVRFVSLIPDHATLAGAVREALAAKGL
ncbi:MAG: uroporphyrinogen decarboxylase family protein [Planctomycetota bacterium]|nr:uroporphyrinogen decarboxylase [Planctomycetota bacterium]MCX8040136.1 uroporphyrinogen decarboxylase [Planctomycetota bacterium]MDW8373406.1 uroporphyrinogen decarboxylase family protein [Planctomycetota bacterium]